MKHPFGGKGSKKNNTELCLVNKNKKTIISAARCLTKTRMLEM